MTTNPQRAKETPVDEIISHESDRCLVMDRVVSRWDRVAGLSTISMAHHSVETFAKINSPITTNHPPGELNRRVIHGQPADPIDDDQPFVVRCKSIRHRLQSLLFYNPSPTPNKTVPNRIPYQR